jgi:hypothetical protein
MTPTTSARKGASFKIIINCIGFEPYAHAYVTAVAFVYQAINLETLPIEQLTLHPISKTLSVEQV